MPESSPLLPFEIDDAFDQTLVTDWAGVPLVIGLFHQLGVAQAIDAAVAVKQRQRGLPPSQLLESLIAFWASGGDRCQDPATLREVQALATLLGQPLPAATTTRTSSRPSTSRTARCGRPAPRRRSPWRPPPWWG